MSEPERVLMMAYGYSTGLIRDIALELLGVPYSKAVKLQEAVSKRLDEGACDTLETMSGKTFTVSFDPAEPEKWPR